MVLLYLTCLITGLIGLEEQIVRQVNIGFHFYDFSKVSQITQLFIYLFRDFLKMDKKALAKFINFFLEDICQNHNKVICSYVQQ